MNIEEINIADLIPQQAPFIMLDALTHFDQVFTRTRLFVKPENIFVDNNQLSASGIMENMAQTCAARMGYINKYLSSEAVKVGFIGSIKNLVFNELPTVGDEVNTTIEVVDEIFHMMLIHAKVEVNGRLIASCEMKIAV